MEGGAALSAATSSRSSAGAGRARLVLTGIVYTVAILAGAAVVATLILVALSGHPVGLLTVPAGAVIPVILWSVWKLPRLTHDLLQKRYLALLQELPAGSIVDERGTAGVVLTITLPGADDTLSSTSLQILRELLTNYPEAASLRAEASHRRALANASAATVRQEAAAVQAARLNYEELRHRLDARRRPIHFGTGLFFLAFLGVGLTVLDALELSELVPGVYTVFPALAATVVWLTLAWLAAIAGRKRRRSLVAATGVGSILLGLLLAALHGTGQRRGWPATVEHIHEIPVLYILVGVSLIALDVGAAVLIAHVESASLFIARRRWRRARAGYEAAIQAQAADAAAASVALEAWLDLVRRQANTATDSNEHVVHGAVVLAADLL